MQYYKIKTRGGRSRSWGGEGECGSVPRGGNVVDAQATYGDCGDIPNFQGSDEQRTAYNLLNGYRDADVDAIKAAVSKSASVGFLEAPFARAAKKLPKPGHDLKEMSVRMGGDGGKLTEGQCFLGGDGGDGGGGGGGGGNEEDDLT